MEILGEYFTQVFITIVPGLELEKRGYRKGNNMLLHLILICVAFISFNPWCNQWKEICPDVFSFENKVIMEELLKSAVFRCIKSDAKKYLICFCFDINCSSVMQVGTYKNTVTLLIPQ